MSLDERIAADFRGTGLTVGRHPLALRRGELDRMRVTPAVELQDFGDGTWIRAAGCVICRQRPGTAHGFVFLSLEDETGIANAIVTPDLFDIYKSTITGSSYLMVEGVLQNQQGVVSVKAKHVESLAFAAPSARSHDFY